MITLPNVVSKNGCQMLFFCCSGKWCLGGDLSLLVLQFCLFEVKFMGWSFPPWDSWIVWVFRGLRLVNQSITSGEELEVNRNGGAHLIRMPALSTWQSKAIRFRLWFSSAEIVESAVPAFRLFWAPLVAPTWCTWCCELSANVVKPSLEKTSLVFMPIGKAR